MIMYMNLHYLHVLFEITNLFFGEKSNTSYQTIPLNKPKVERGQLERESRECVLER